MISSEKDEKSINDKFHKRIRVGENLRLNLMFNKEMLVFHSSVMKNEEENKYLN